MKQILNFEPKKYEQINTECSCVTGGGGCQCDDDTSE